MADRHDMGALMAELTVEARRTCALSPAPVYTFDGWRFDTGRRSLTSPAQEVIRLTSRDVELLTLFCLRPQEMITRQEMMCGRYIADQRSVDVAITRLRRKLQDVKGMPALIMHVRALGYQFTAPVEAT